MIAHRLRPALGRLAFALLSTVIVVVFSEKVYWYITGYSFFILMLGYFWPIYTFLWAIDTFRVRRLAPLFLAAAVYGFLVEGVIVATVYEGGMTNWLTASNAPLAWHAPLSILFGWYALRRWLAAGNRRALWVGCAAIGLFWGLWAMAWWLPKNIVDPILLAQGARVGQWPAADFAAHAFTFTAVLALAHWLLGRLPRTDFRPSAIEGLLVLLGLLYFFATAVLPTYPWAPLKLLPLLGASVFGLYVNKRREPPGSLLDEPAGPFPVTRLLPLFAMPAVATAVYTFGVVLPMPIKAIYLIDGYGIVIGTAILGGLAFLAAIVRIVAAKEKPQQPSATTEV